MGSSALMSTNLFGKALESAPDAIVIVDTAGQILFANHRVQAVLGYDPAELVGQPIEILLPEPLRTGHLAHRAGYARHAQVRPMGINLELTALRKEGTEVPVEISLSPIHDDERTLTAAAIRDVTERKRILRELKQAREAADRANLAKTRFLATASHDLRQPLQALALLNGALRRMALDEDQLEIVGQQDRAITTMSRLLNALLDISKLESGAIQPAPVDFRVQSLFEDLHTEFINMAASKGLGLAIEYTGVCAHSDPDLVGQILRNLVSNAIKYTRQGEVRLRAGSDGSRVRLEVLDTGIGIPADQLPFIYDEFYQVGVATNSNRDGYGLGLSIVRRLTNLLDIRLELVSQIGKGTACLLEIPLGRGTGVSPPTPVPTAQPRPAFTPVILLVDDDAGVRNATAMLLRVVGCRVLSAGSVAEAREVATRNPDIGFIVSDYHLDDGRTGLDAIAAVRAILGRSCSAVLVTGDTSAAMRTRESEGIRLASKPIKADELLALIRSLPGTHT